MPAATPQSGFLRPIGTEVVDQATGAIGFARLAHVTAVQNEPVMGVAFPFRRNGTEEFVLDLARGFACGQAGAVGKAKDMGVHGDGRLPPDRVEDDVGGFATNSGQGLQGFPVTGHVIAEGVAQDRAELDDVACLAVEETDRLDVLAQTVLAQSRHLRRRVGDRE